MGGGGKTTAIFQLARALIEKTNQPVIVTATSHLGVEQVIQADLHIALSENKDWDLKQVLSRGVIVITGPQIDEKLRPIHDDALQQLVAYCDAHSLPLLVEADGSRQKPVKAWAAHEPPIPSFIEHVVQVVGLSAIGQPVKDVAHRPGIFSGLTDLQPIEAVTTESVVRVLTHADAGLKNMPNAAIRTVLLNQADNDQLQGLAFGMVTGLLHSYDTVIIAQLNAEKILAVHEHIAGVVLAAGASTRYGEPKQLLSWQNQPFVRAVAQKALNAGLHPVLVITGAKAEEVEAAVTGLDVQVVRNIDWEQGQSTSVRAAITALKKQTEIQLGGAIFLLVDQPQIGSAILRALMQTHAKELASILIPMIDGQRANPVLFDRLTFDDLLTLEGDQGGRAIFHRYRVQFLPWYDDSLLLDVDTPEMYQRLLSDPTLGN